MSRLENCWRLEMLSTITKAMISLKVYLNQYTASDGYLMTVLEPLFVFLVKENGFDGEEENVFMQNKSFRLLVIVVC